MELVLESKLIENIDLNQVNSNFYSVHSLKTNRPKNTNAGDPLSPKSSDTTTVSQFLDQNSTLNKDFTLSLISSNLPIVNESKLRENLAKKIEKGTFYASQFGSISAFNLGFKNDEADLNSICYHNYFRQTKDLNNQYLVCFILVDDSNNLDLFRNELDLYFESSLKEFFEKTNKDFLINNDLDILLTNWFSNSMGYLYRVIELLKENISFFIEEAFSCGIIGYEGLTKQDQDDLSYFAKSFDCTKLIMNSALESEKTLKEIIEKNQNDSNSKLIIKLDKSIEDKQAIVLSRNLSSQFSNECAQAIIDIYNTNKNLFSIKQLIENYKLKLIKDLNTFNRYLRKGKSQYYDLFKAVLHLRYSKNSEILIKAYQNCEKKEMSGVMSVFSVVVDFYDNISRDEDDNDVKARVLASSDNQKDFDQSKRILERFAEKFPISF